MAASKRQEDLAKRCNMDIREVRHDSSSVLKSHVTIIYTG